MKAIQLKRFLAESPKNGLGLSGADAEPEDPRYIRITDIGDDGRLRSDVYASQPRHVVGEAKVVPGDLLVASVGATVGKSYLHRENGEFCYAGYLTRVRPDQDLLNPAFLYYWTQSHHYWDQVRTRVIASTIENLSSSKIGTFLIPSVDTSYQRAIADYLDHETAEIDAFIADLEDLQTRLMEEGEARIYAAVTGRFGDNSSFPTPGTDWTGPLPEGWATPRVSWVFGNIGSGTTPRSEDQQAFGDEVPWVTTGELREQRIDDTIRRLSRRALAEYPALEVFPPGSLLIAMYGATIGRLGWLGQPAAVNQAVCAMSGYKYGSYKYMFYVLRAARPYLLSRAVGGGQPNINQEIIRSLRVPMPTGAEQAEIVQQLEETMQHITEMSVLAAESVALAKERRAALISAAVTGQIDVTAKHKPAAEQLEDDIAQLD